jgi:hypothetical protein
MTRRSVGLLALMACAAAGRAQAPTPEQTGAAIEMSRKMALSYTRSLPDFVCTQWVHRYLDFTHRGFWRLLDTLTIKLSYFELKEDHKLVLINGMPSERSYRELIGAVTEGEFGSILNQIFDSSSQAVFTWEKWAKVSKRRAAIYLYHVDRFHSGYALNFGGGRSGAVRATVAYRGMVEVDRDTGDVLRLTYTADAIPKTYPIHSATTTVSYAFADVGGRQYLLPESSETEMRSVDMWARNHTDFREYRKFSADSTITFGDGK